MQMLDKGYWIPPVHPADFLTLVHCGIKPNKPNELVGPVPRDLYLLHFVIKGKGTYATRDKTFHLKEGDVFAIHQNEVAFYQADEHDPWYFCWIGFVGTGAAECYRKIGITREHPILHLNNSLFVEGVLNCLHYMEKNETAVLSPFRLSGFVFEILSAFETDSTNSKSSCIEQVISYMEFNYHKKLSLFSLAEYVNLEYSYFFRLFKKAVGMSPMNYLTNLRIEKAKHLLQAGMPLKRVPELVGISDVYYFSKLFKKVTGETPSHYQRQNAGTGGDAAAETA